ncbi:sulfatase [bacterium]|nr:sulfatase [bacterium]
MKKLLVLAAVGIAGVLAYAAFRHVPSPKEEILSSAKLRPLNILYLTSESFNLRHLGCYGYPKPTSPNIDRLAAEGVRFTQMVNASAWTNESLVSVFMSLESGIHGVITRSRNVDPRWYTPLEILHDLGYSIPRLQGFQGDQNHSFLGFDDVEYVSEFDWFRRHAGSVPQPFFLFWHYLPTHLPYNAGEPYESMFFREDMIRSPESRARVERVRKDSVIYKNSVTFQPEDRDAIAALYDAEIRRFDDFVGSLMEELKSAGLDKNTLVIIGCDHGEEIMEHGHVGHSSTTGAGHMFEELVHVPLILWAPEMLPKGKVIDAQMRTIDIIPTIFELLGVPAPAYFRGASMLGDIRAAAPAVDRMAFAQTSRYGFGEPDPFNVPDYIYCARTPEWKFITYVSKNEPTREELYHLTADPFERENVLEKFQKEANELRVRLTERLIEYGTIKPVPLDVAVAETPWEKILDFFGLFGSDYDFSKVPRPVWTNPTDGMAWSFDKTGGLIRLEWKGLPDCPYVIGYELGQGDYHLTGEVKVEGNVKDFGSFSKDYWTTYLVVRNPFTLRVSPDMRPRQWSEPVTFRFEP